MISSKALKGLIFCIPSCFSGRLDVHREWSYGRLIFWVGAVQHFHRNFDNHVRP